MVRRNLGRKVVRKYRRKRWMYSKTKRMVKQIRSRDNDNRKQYNLYLIYFGISILRK